jgi:type IV secretory pathway protease TraF
MKNLSIFAIASAGILLLIASSLYVSPWLVWNASNSAPVGLYFVEHVLPRKGDLAIIRLPPRIGAFAHRRSILPASTYLLKPVAAVAGEHICRIGRTVLVQRMTAARIHFRDRLGRPLPSWRGCRQLVGSEVFLLASEPQSFDSRYFGPLPADRAVGRAVRIWLAPAKRRHSSRRQLEAD